MGNNYEPALELLKGELEFVRNGSFKHCPHSPWCAPHNLADYTTCHNFLNLARTEVCRECWLMQFIEPERREEEVPCRFVQLTAGGATVDSLCRCSTPAETAQTLRLWLEQRIHQLQQDVLGTMPASNPEKKSMTNSTYSDPAEHDAFLRFCYRDWRPTRVGRWLNRFWGWWSSVRLPPRSQALLEVRGRTSGLLRANPVAITTVEGQHYLVSMLGTTSDWVKNVEAAEGVASIRHGWSRPVHLVPVPVEQRAPILREYVRVARSGRKHFPVAVGAPLSQFQTIAERYPVYRIDDFPS